MPTVYRPTVDVERPLVLGGPRWSFSGLSQITVFFGKNGSGKSLLLRAVRNEDAHHSHYVPPERSGDFTPNMSSIPLQFDADNRRERSQTNAAPGHRTMLATRIQALLLRMGAEPEVMERLPHADITDPINSLLPEFVFSIEKASPHFSIRRHGSQNVTSQTQLSSGEAQVLGLAIDVTTMAAAWH